MCLISENIQLNYGYKKIAKIAPNNYDNTYTDDTSSDVHNNANNNNYLNYSPEYKNAMNEAIYMMATNKKNLTEITATMDKLLLYSPNPEAKKLNSKIIMKYLEKEVTRNVTENMRRIFMKGDSKHYDLRGRIKRAGAVCVNTVTQIGTIIGSVAGGAILGGLLTSVLPVIGSTIGAYFGGILGAIIFAQISFRLANALCP